MVKLIRGEWRRIFMVVSIILATGLFGCALTQRASVSGENYCPFLGADLCAKLTPGTAGQLYLRYVNPNATVGTIQEGHD